MFLNREIPKDVLERVDASALSDLIVRLCADAAITNCARLHRVWEFIHAPSSPYPPLRLNGRHYERRGVKLLLRMTRALQKRASCDQEQKQSQRPLAPARIALAGLLKPSKPYEKQSWAWANGPPGVRYRVLILQPESRDL